MLRLLFIFGFLMINTFASAQGSNRIVTNYTGMIKELKGANSPLQDFSMVVSQGKAFFASSREASLIHYKENNWNKSPKINVWQADVEKINDYFEINLLNVSPFMEIRDEFTHVGPISFSVTGDTLFFTKVPKKLIDKSIKVFKPQLYMLVRVNGRWNKTPQILPFNNPLFSFAHPTFHSASNALYFVSDQKGGEGGKDIYVANITDGKWSKPVNLKHINSKKDELFPFISADQTLFFSSDRAESTGGLDVFFNEYKNLDVRHLDYVNSAADDFGIFMVEDKNIGFVSSNRNGNDDLFTFTVNKEQNLRNSVFGKFKYRQLDEAIERPLSVFLLNEKKEPIQETFVNEDGEFEFFDVGLTEQYTVKAKSKAEMDLVLYDSEGNPDSKLLADETNEFVYTMVDIKDIGNINLTQVNKMGETLIAGRFLFEDEPWEEPGVLKINLIDQNGKVARTVQSDIKGYFDFKNLPSDKDYLVKLEKENTDLTLIIFNEDGKIVERLKDDGNGFYLYRQLKLLEVNNLREKKPLREEPFSFDSGIINGDFDRNGENVEFQDELKISVYDEDGNLKETLLSDKNGVFSYEKVPGIDNYEFQLDQMKKSFDKTGISLKILDENGKVIKEIKPEASGAFEYNSLDILNIQALQSMNSMDEGDFDLFVDELTNELEGKIKYNNENIDIKNGLEVSVYDMDDNLKSTLKTNRLGEFKFEKMTNITDFNLKITEKPDSMRMDLFSIDITSENGQETKTILPLPSGNFEYRKLDVIDNAATLNSLTQIEESVDLIFDIIGNYDYNNQEGDFEEKLKIAAFDGNGNKIGEVLTDGFGNFVFQQLPGISTVLFKIENAPSNFDLDKFTLFIEGEEGKQLAKLRSSEKGFFVYKPLGFNSELPFEIKEKLDDNEKHAVFGTSALDFSNEIESVYFGSNKTNPNSNDILKIEKMLLLLEINPTSQLEINAYADSRASDNYNLILSEKRAEWIKSFLARKGISADRIVINVYGEGKLVNDCKDGVDCPDQEHALNRRAELRIFI